ncbi:MAG TPA: hypothetical protein VNJ12_07720 [Candidatus Dormibacteraeota bacterium]|nr:hypothetical protein [Candidatus Dormibacteraeota bacterium]
MVLVSLSFAFWRPRLGARWFSFLERKLAPLARRKPLAVLTAGFAAIAARLAVLPILPVPHPFVPDEFSFLLAANTFASGRLTNPAHPMWIHFETLHVLMKPTFMSMYPPAQGLFLAAGKVATGLPFAGVLLSAGLMCAAITWMLQGWFSPGWAFLGGMIAVMRFSVFSYWVNSYWGGTVAALGGALVLGALPRILRFERPADAVWMGLGLAILANSRPYEGLVFSLPVAVVLFAWLSKKRGAALGQAIRRAIAPLTLVVLLAGAGMGYYFWRVTGNPFHMPQEVNREHYAVAPYFFWQSPRPAPVYHHQALRDFYLGNEMGFYREGRTVLGDLGIEIVRYVHFWCFFLGPLLTLPLLLAIVIVPRDSVWARWDWRMRFLVVATAVSLGGLAVEVFYFDHYAAPMTCLILALVIEALRRVRAWRPHGRPVGRLITRAVPAICLLMLVVRAGATTLHLPITPAWPPMPYNSVNQITDFTRINHELNAYPGNHLVLMRYVHDVKAKGLWVYNENGDIDREREVWAWDMGPEKNRELIRYYKNRDVWLVVPEGSHVKLSRYTEPPPH